ncbi:gamma-butyrobetaine hydroxylase-like domain-containing protein [Paraburkholderia sp. BCC1885]|jgi:DUF971 family protein|uniref:gamma-butyrobetaine hydroxylase-like domain-containing protein n=1 Tax=Paraburkholderia sp. BCC1885 TaxID=2562669 RepID=UPI00118354C0|nr:DUF971 domain-containing protein [Paraburkholderia sp. BCC1885]
MNDAPPQIVSNAVTRRLTLHWPDGREQQLAHAQLRQACACAECRRIRIDGGALHTSDDVTLVDVQSMGYGVQLVFSDGHARGIYPWHYLAQLAETQVSPRDQAHGQTPGEA